MHHLVHINIYTHKTVLWNFGIFQTTVCHKPIDHRHNLRASIVFRKCNFLFSFSNKEAFLLSISTLKYTECINKKIAYSKWYYSNAAKLNFHIFNSWYKNSQNFRFVAIFHRCRSMLLILKSYQKGKTLFCIWCRPTQNSSALYIFHKFIQKPAVHCTFSTRLYTNQQWIVHFPHVYTQTSSALYNFHTIIQKPAVHCTFSIRLYTNQ